jgi:glycosyltransferase EpsE
VPNTKPKVSVVIPAYNCETTLGECLQSLFLQTEVEWEAILCDDCSTDRTLDIARAFAKDDPRIRILRSESNQGPGATRNRCIREARGEYTAIMDADDVMLAGRLAIQSAFLDSHPAYGFVGGGVYYFDKEGIWGQHQYRHRRHRDNGDILKRDFLISTPVVHCSVMFRTAVLRTIGGYKVGPRYLRGEDYDLLFRVFAAGYKGRIMDEAVVKVRYSASDYRRRRFYLRLHEMRIRYAGYRSLRMPWWGYVYVLKPLISGSIPPKVMWLLHRLRFGRSD